VTGIRIDPLAVREAGRAASLPIAETYVSIQGEGKLVGVPSFFVRVSGCNLRCRWCDTPYASWKPEGSVRAIEELVAEAKASGVRHAVLTGGEPMMFGELCELSARLATPTSGGGAGMHVTVETAGTVIPASERWPLTCRLMSISPKLSNSTPRDDLRDPDGVWARRHEERRLNVAVIQRLIDGDGGNPAADRDFQLKFVVCTEADLIEADALLARLTGWEPSDVLLMPEGVTPPTPAMKSLVSDACLKRGFRYCPRLHIELFGNRRGT